MSNPNANIATCIIESEETMPVPSEDESKNEEKRDTSGGASNPTTTLTGASDSCSWPALLVNRMKLPVIILLIILLSTVPAGVFDAINTLNQRLTVLLNIWGCLLKFYIKIRN